MNANADVETYLGDGVYAKFDGFAVELWTERAGNGRNWLVLEPREFEALKKFWAKFHCPHCGSNDVSREHHNPTFAVPECDYTVCAECEHQWDHS